MYEENKEARGMTYTGLETYVQQAAFDQTLTRLYGAEGAEKAHSRCMEVMEEFYKIFDRSAEALFSAPGRTEIGGNHTDHQKGCVLAASVDLDILAAVAPTQSGIIRVLSQGYPMIEVDLRELDPKEEEINTSAALIRGVASCMSAMGCDLRERGLDVYMTSTVPKGSGLSSSAAYEVLMGTMFNELFWEGRCTAVELAQIGQYAENVFFGKPCGLMDQMASSVGGVVSIDFENTAHPAVEQLDVDLHAYGYALCILDSGAGHEDLTNEYSAITNELRAVCRVFDKEVLREVPEEAFLAELPKVRAAAGDRAVNRAFHVYAENRRALAEKEALRQGDFDKFLALAECHSHRKHGGAGTDGDHRPVRAYSGGAGRCPCPRRWLRWYRPGLCAAGYVGHLQESDGGGAGQGLLPCGDDPASWRRQIGIRRTDA